jgi:hypothetical protein
VINTIPTLAWSADADGSAEFFNQRWRDYTGLSAKETCGWGWTVALDTDDMDHVVVVGGCAKILLLKKHIDNMFRRLLSLASWHNDNV